MRMSSGLRAGCAHELGLEGGWRAYSRVGGRVVVIIQVGGLVHSGHNSGWRAGGGHNSGWRTCAQWA